MIAFKKERNKREFINHTLNHALKSTFINFLLNIFFFILKKNVIYTEVILFTEHLNKF